MLLRALEIVVGDCVDIVCLWYVISLEVDRDVEVLLLL
jgi:hypothetical protein